MDRVHAYRRESYKFPDMPQYESHITGATLHLKTLQTWRQINRTVACSLFNSGWHSIISSFLFLHLSLFVPFSDLDSNFLHVFGVDVYLITWSILMENQQGGKSEATGHKTSVSGRILAVSADWLWQWGSLYQFQDENNKNKSTTQGVFCFLLSVLCMQIHSMSNFQSRCDVKMNPQHWTEEASLLPPCVADLVSFGCLCPIDWGCLI